MSQSKPRRSTVPRQALPPFRLTPLRRAMTAALASATAVPGTAAAAQAIEEVVVTATKRAESTQDVPIAITALTGDFSEARNLNDVKDLISFTPGVSGNSQDSFIDAVSVRGIRTQDFGVGGDPSAAFFKNDLYEGRNGAVVTSLYDMERSEILRGPQGFLFGRNSIGGAFSVHTREAEIGGAPTGFLDLDVGERGHLVGEGAVNLPVNDQFAMRLAGYYSEEDGFVDNAFGGDDLIEHEKWALRWSTAINIDRLSVDTMVEYENREQSGSVYRAVENGAIWETFEAAIGDVDLGGGEYDADSDLSFGESDDADILTLGLRVEYDLDWATLSSNTGFKDHDYFYSEDYDGTPLNLNNYQQDQQGEYFQQELRLTSNGSGPLSWYAGFSYYREEIDTLFRFVGEEDFFCQYYGYYYNGITFTGCADLYAYYGSPFTSVNGLLTETGRIRGEYDGWGAYVDVNLELGERWDVGIGARATEDRKDFAINVPLPESELGAYWAYTFATDGFISAEESWDDVTTRFQLRFRPTDESMIYASYTEGFKAGGFGSFALSDPNGDPVGGGVTGLTQAAGFRPNTFDPETVDSYELGYKTTLAERAQLSLTAFYYEYEDLQVVTFDGGAAAVRNVGEVESFGLEGTVNAVLNQYVDFYVALSYLDSEAKGLQSICGLADPEGCEGSDLFWAPEYTGAAVLNGSLPVDGGGTLIGSVEWFWESERGGGWEDLSSTKIDAFSDVTLRFGYESGNNWSMIGYIENLTDEDTWDGLNNNGGVLPSHFFGPKRPRTFGVRLRYDWQ